MRWFVLLALLLSVPAAHAAESADEPDADVPHLLVFSGTYGFRHESIPEAVELIRSRAESTGAYTVEWTEDPAVFSPSLYERIDGVVLVHTTGLGGPDAPFTAQQKDDFVDFFACGGALAGVHAATDSGGGWPEYDELFGAAFDFHPHFSLETRDGNPLETVHDDSGVADVSVQVEDQTHVATAPWHGQDSFRIVDELYRWKEDPRPNVDVLLSLDEQTHYWPLAGAGVPSPIAPLPVVGYPDDSPLAWTKTYGAGRVFYTNLGHRIGTWSIPEFQNHMINGLTWAAGQRPDPACVSERIGA